MKKLIGLILVILFASGSSPFKSPIAATRPETNFQEVSNLQAGENAIRPVVRTQTSTPACTLTSPVHDEWNTLVCETFDNAGTWWTGTDLNSGLQASVEEGKYRINYNAKNSRGYTTGFAYTMPITNAKDYVVSMTGLIDSKFKNCTWGLTVRGTSRTEGYWFAINNMGTYYLTFWGSTRKFIGNLKYGVNKNIVWNAENTITILVEGRDLTFYVNDKPIMTYRTNDDTRTDISWSIWGAEGVSVDYEFDNVIVKEKP